ncbi:hypothetical protein PsorP6_011408 [Peronosclerospora sorghi]|uniref:Uncharacterized protein n=1 Tax=Peronosclerospora sorghi TaxID=230839 RepID=A0ACC0WK37_9STRA|nr:hypothetical protein PsorP6_011408 [Peronosclerospora sorghi]
MWKDHGVYVHKPRAGPSGSVSAMSPHDVETDGVIKLNSLMDAAKVWGYNNSYRKWQVVAEPVGHTDAIHDVCWAPSMGQSFH